MKCMYKHMYPIHIHIHMSYPSINMCAPDTVPHHPACHAVCSLQVLNLVIFPRPEYDLPFFCADLVTFPKGHLIVL